MSTQNVAVSTEAGIDPQRTRTVAALFELALLLEQHPEIPIPYQLTKSTSLTIHLLSSQDPRGELARIVRLLPGPVEKSVSGGHDGFPSYFDATATIGDAIRVTVTAFRDDVCERVVTGTREVTKTIPDPAVDVPTIEVTETVEDVEWVCGPLMRGQVER